MLSRTFLSRLKSLRGSRLLQRGYVDKPEENEDGDKEEAPGVADLLKNAASFNEATDTMWMTTPYPQGAPSTPEGAKPERKILDPLDFSVLLFPGQGVLKVGMIKQYMMFPRVQELYENANEALGYDLRKLCLSGPQERLDRTEFNQPATVVASLAALEKLWEERPRAIENSRVAAGYSVGEITALIFCGALTIDDGIRLAGVRGAAMQAASEAAPQGMLSVFCSAGSKIHKTCEEAKNWARNLGVNDPVCQIAIYQFTQTKVIAGHEEALRYIEKSGGNQGLRRIKRLPVSGAFHTPLMQPAVNDFKEALNAVDLAEPRIDVYSNVTGRVYQSANTVRKLLVKQMMSPVKWEQCVQMIYDRPADKAYPRTFDLGSGGTMKIILKHINAKASDHCYEI